MSGGPVAARWDAEYREGRYVAEPPVPFVDDVVSTLRAHPEMLAGIGLYVGCGNGRNYLPLVDTGLNLHGLDISGEALDQLAARRPELASRLTRADFRDLALSQPFDYLVAIQVFQHGFQADASVYFARAAAALRPDGLLFVRVNAATTEIYFTHTVIEQNLFGGLTVRYDDGPKAGLCVHFYSADELRDLTRDRFRLVAGPREVVTRRAPPKTGTWAQWEAVWQKRGVD